MGGVVAIRPERRSRAAVHSGCAAGAEPGRLAGRLAEMARGGPAEPPLVV